MRLLPKILWFIAFLAATFCWMVLFEHGFSVNNFTKGVGIELRELMEKISGGAKAEPDKGQEAPVTPPPGDTNHKA